MILLHLPFQIQVIGINIFVDIVKLSLFLHLQFFRICLITIFLGENKMSIALSPAMIFQSNNPALTVQAETWQQDKSPRHKNSFYMELTAQRSILPNEEITIRYTSVFEVNTKLLLKINIKR